ncbi:hypothetical protein CRENBAI_026889 [Crenichthys baileyi]|uniref:Uncharacterized protein n=1 Tax=Crenichthys baileyi TaxID=28760 RepID=A0AAV9RA40_9TELE
MREKREKKTMKRRWGLNQGPDVFPTCQSVLKHCASTPCPPATPPSLPLVCAGCRSGDIATGFGPNCRNSVGNKDNRGCWGSGRQLSGSDNEGCILIFPRRRRLEKAVLLLPHHPVWKPINPTIWEQSAELSLGHCSLPVSYHHPVAATKQQQNFKEAQCWG